MQIFKAKDKLSSPDWDESPTWSSMIFTAKNEEEAHKFLKDNNYFRFGYDLAFIGTTLLFQQNTVLLSGTIYE